ncbi:unnamed protein product [Penicillium nalgiovense]|uniref:Uncharacterized protein n=1 Tax=Penicillium nalgiovense TaxID=60175 RepID=A0A9W4IBJ5_PENNA|nr:unnamed protein product [Penicillium nalgiovense]CAG8011333.1 unnamed protein product [Penicillium nalgiovense]CAG8046190.1 unnamed protein product [Penicillium nalgiovense]CAG8057627.1 unnamed protein product [Penicillium nalgiovense]CAG8091196.1 unnamed protein product [Penicillium nalgiovense]
MSTSLDETSNAPDASNVRWQFIDSSNNSRTNLTQVKRHVMQEYMRQKKGGTRQSESEEEEPRAKRGRPKKTRVAKRRPEKKAKSDDDNNNNQPRARRSTRKQVTYKEDLNVEVNCDVFASDPISSDPALIEPNDVPSFSPFRSSSAQPQDVPLPLDGFVDVHPQSSPSHDLYFNNTSWPSQSTISYQSMPSPNTMSSDARIDTFNTLPIELNRNGHRIFDSYLNDMPASSYESHYLSPMAHNCYTPAFVPEIMEGTVAFQNAISYMQLTLRKEEEIQNNLLHRGRTASVLQEHNSDNPHDISDAAIIPCLSAAALEDCDPRPGHEETSWTCMRAAREMIRARDGPAAFANTRIGMMTNWENYVLPGYETQGASFFYECDQNAPFSSDSLASVPQLTPKPRSIPSPPYSTSSAFSEVSPSLEPRTILPPHSVQIPVDEIKFQCEEFFDFLRRCEQLALYQRDNPQLSYITRHTAVQETSILHQILATPPDAQFTTSDNRKQMIAHLTVLMTLNAAMWDYRNTPGRAALFLDTIEKSIVDSEVSMNGSVDARLQTLLECSDGTFDGWPTSSDGFASAAPVEELPDFSQYFPTATSPSARPWFAGRMLKIAQRLSPLSWYRVNEFLFSCLTLQVRESCMALWEADLRREILDAPTTYVMGSLTE